ncbi:hypothetical protein GPALN_005982 [Globodera pallida]|nr:hypothetical protein GPALN_005982 [Globodera pallida]
MTCNGYGRSRQLQQRANGICIEIGDFANPLLSSSAGARTEKETVNNIFSLLHVTAAKRRTEEGKAAIKERQERERQVGKRSERSGSNIKGEDPFHWGVFYSIRSAICISKLRSNPPTNE